MKVKKASGDLVEFDESKLIHSLMRSGANDAQSERVLLEIKKLLVDGMSTKKIYRKAYKMLRQYSSHFAARYHLKQGVLQLGPTGYVFEQFIAHIFKVKGYTTETNLYLKGKCVFHEMDVVAKNEEEFNLIECKFKNTQGLKSDVKVPLYIHSRVNDLKKGVYKGKNTIGWIITNTEFSEDAIEYAKCSGLKLVSWKYPQKGNLRDLIEEKKVFPITCLSSLTKKEKEVLVSKNILFLDNLFYESNILEALNLSKSRQS